MQDARFTAAHKPLALLARSSGDIEVISALLQDALGLSGDMIWQQRRHRFVAVVNRFLWEGKTRRPMRAGAALRVEYVQRVLTCGFSPGDQSQAFEILALQFEPGDDGSGVLRLVCANDAEIRLEVEALEVIIEDIGGAWEASQQPQHEI